MINNETNKPDICIAIPTHLTGEVIYYVLSSIAQVNYPKDRLKIYVIIWDKDLDTLNYTNKAKNEFNLNLDIHFIESPNVNLKRNLGIKLCSNFKYILLLDDDIIIHPETINAALKHFANDSKVKAVGFPVVSDCSNMAERLNHCRYVNTVVEHSATMPITVFSSDVFERVGLFREDMGPPLTIHEDWEMGSRIRKYGYKVILDGRYPGKDLGSQTLRKRMSSKVNNTINKKEGIIKRLVDYARSYVRKGWWSMYQVFKSSPLDQLLEYAFYFINPLLFIALLIINWMLGLGYLGMVIVGILINTFTKRYYSVFPVKERIAYSLLIIVIRMFRMYLFLIALLINAFKGSLSKA